ncbi:tetratricopeptide (TPR) repeat protein [Sphingomonas jejuensis]|uniref:Tetratricopeptide (TPR) repeat protein n=1 Tax=Sphingomonas jejuensis TaxID=904715 RepID=A0ABX0XNU8_9SPHN|nr:tetratricopeptide repeat protein [Sphingomonas jejuensis]NJC35058.1 tetratricopeptide (TPR) repeat protein [Sphingomonas jejuensis]
MILPFFLLVQAAATGPTLPDEARFDACIAAVARAPDEGVAEAERWQAAGGGVLARQCLGLAHAAATRWPAAATSFEGAARAAEVARDGRAARLWAQAGNAWLAGGAPAQAVTALDAALAQGATEGELLGEVHLDRARALVALDRLSDARVDLDAATRLAPRDPLAWLLSATLARRQGDLARAQADIGEAATRAPDDASVALEAGLIAANQGNDAAARAAWNGAIAVQPGSPAAAQARSLLAQLDGTAVPAAPAIEPGR